MTKQGYDAGGGNGAEDSLTPTSVELTHHEDRYVVITIAFFIPILGVLGFSFFIAVQLIQLPALAVQKYQEEINPRSRDNIPALGVKY